ncbi:IS701 family transposase [Streptomyces spectabilis]|uniref:Transposase n=1 Tax=Streptomyces spectabilis TaxID=68270 RepID=A0A5P2XIJ7_STRST|nr:transposase [Streptomyces spectabilis]MBB5107958.1 hypothetical protein [Streptomyces spectabilis]MCI3907938.1 transposase [Streptomyces spectabilis]QEV57393.1 transposase [Streptomyces spectabilis]QEV64361.1 transposase [Streptomyces spectabilis]GGV53955.1 hypothetical protein GCM10010245_85240 [Streptomyces spectabilis]
MAGQQQVGVASAAGGSDPLPAFAAALFGHLPRADQRRWAQGYLQGLLSTPGKKSVRRLAAAISDSPTASQSLQQFINASPWEWDPARKELTRYVEQRGAPRAWIIATAVLPKRGGHSCGVHRRFVPEAGRTINCQLGIGVFLSLGELQLPVDWRLMLPEQWNADERLRERARIPALARHRPLWAHAADLAATLARRTRHTPAPVVADMSDHTDVAQLIEQLHRQGRAMVVSVPPGMGVCPATARTTAAHLGAHSPGGARQFLYQHSTRHPHVVTVTTPEHGQRHIRILSGLIRLPGTAHTLRIFTQWRPSLQRPARVWVSNLLDARLDELMALAQLHTRTRATMTHLEDECGLLDFEGRSYPGWHHHMTLVSAAYAYSRLCAPASAAAPPLPRTA